ncbi:hypothetical protein DFR50_15712 [Roseiarcus fermentans]|uniref:Uncharacterized protein n=1 Tax=Roseiarcus fermentans TaxID=1473586 RepID=A0A366EHQ7_9HYPH|nr:hypothetical protein [Roseiarcus fermentans]RBP01250.1 hypothetical protein DFR50_15712 [Roseiarcus fermentans]
MPARAHFETRTDRKARGDGEPFQAPIDDEVKNPLEKEPNHRTMLSVVNSRKEVIQCLIVIRPV